MKRLELLKDAFPQIQALTVFWDQLSAHQWEAVPNTATSLGLRLAGVELRGQPRDYEQALTQAPPEYRSALFVLASPLFLPTAGVSLNLLCDTEWYRCLLFANT